MSVARTFYLSSGAAFAFAVFLSAAPGVAAQEPVDFISNFQIVSAAIDMDTRVPTITFVFDCLADVGLVRLRTRLVQEVGNAPAALSIQPREVRNCVAGTTVTLEVTHGFQFGGRFRPGPAELEAILNANPDIFFTFDTEAIRTTVLLHPQK